MPSNKDLQSKILELDKGASTDGLNNDELARMLSDAKSNLAETSDVATDALADAEKEALENEIKRPPYYVADGKSVTCKKGMIDAGGEMKVEYLGGGKKSLATLVKAGVVKKA